MRYKHVKPTYDEWRIRGGQSSHGLSIRNGELIKEGFTRGPYTVGPSPVHPSKRSPGFDYAIFDGDSRPQWCGTEHECTVTAERWNESYAMYLMARGTAAENLLNGGEQR